MKTNRAGNHDKGADVPSAASSSETSIHETPSTPLPVLEMGCMLAIQLNEGLMINVLYPFLVFMTERFGYNGSALGIHAGLLASSFCAAQFFSSIVWGRLSDVVGLKPTLIVGTAGSAMAFIMFGLSKTFTQAVLARACAGLLNGNTGLMKCYIAKVTDDSNRAKGFTFLSLAWGRCGPASFPLCLYS